MLKEISSIKAWVSDYYKAIEANEELTITSDFFATGDATEVDVEDAFAKTLKCVENLEFKNMMRDEEDSLSVILNINSGAGGTESC